jgi:hypothetical protein
MMRRVVVAHESLRVVVHRDEEVFITMNERRMRRRSRRPLAFHILIIVLLVTVSSLWNANFFASRKPFPIHHVAVRGRDIIRSDQRVHVNVDDVCGRQANVAFFFWAVVERHFG